MDIYGTVVNPIQNTSGGNSTYSGSNLEPNANLYGAYLRYADLTGANLDSAKLVVATLTYVDLSNATLTNADLTAATLDSADLTGANLIYADLTGADLTYTTLHNADLTNADLSGANLIYADLTGANLTGAHWLEFSTGIPDYDALTNFTGTGFDPVAAGWNLVPEPSTALLLGIGLVGMAGARKRLN